MKQRIFTIILGVMIVFGTVTAYAKTPEIFIDGTKLECEAAPYIVSERTMVPFRAIFSAMDASVIWDADTKTVVASKKIDDTVVPVVLQIGNPLAFVSGAMKELDAPPEIKDDFTFVPLRFVAEALNADVIWNGEEYTININTK